jgi:serine/threonine protein kinase
MDDTHADQLQIMKKIENYLFNLCDKLGEGSFSQVFKGINVLTNGEVAVKKIRTGDIKSKIARRLL